MADEKEKTMEGSADSTALYYGVGAAVLVLLVAGIYLLRPKPATSPTTTSPVAQGATGATLAKPTGPITGLACELQYYNPVIGLKQYYLSVEGADVTDAKTVNCDFSVVVAKKEVAKPSVSPDLVDAATRGGKTFKCATPALGLDPNVPTQVNVTLSDDLKKTATCTATFLLPTP